MIAALTRRAVLLAVAVVCVLAMLPAQQPNPPSPELAPAADTSAFRPGNIISDAVFYDAGAMTAAQVQAFLNQQGRNCTPASGGPACLKSYRMTTESQTADAYCPNAYTGAANETAAAIIVKVAAACRINPRVILVMLQKETSLVTRSAPTEHLYKRAMGFGCAGQHERRVQRLLPGPVPADLLRGQAVQAVRRQPRQLRPRPGDRQQRPVPPQQRVRVLAGHDREQGDRRAVQLHALPAQRAGAGGRLRGLEQRVLVVRQPELLAVLHRLVRQHPDGRAGRRRARSAAWTPSARTRARSPSAAGPTTPAPP